MLITRPEYNNFIINSKINWNDLETNDIELNALYLCDKCDKSGHALSSHMISYVKPFINEDEKKFQEKYCRWLLSCKYSFDFRDKKCFEKSCVSCEARV